MDAQKTLTARHPLAFTHCIHGTPNNAPCSFCAKASDRMKRDMLERIDAAIAKATGTAVLPASKGEAS